MINGTYYQIEVKKDGVHLFATNTSDYQYTALQIQAIRDELAAKFTETAGYTITITSIRAHANVDSLTGTVAN